MRLENYLNSLKKLIDKALDGYLPSEREYPKAIHRAMRYSVFSGGKRIRPILAMESCKVCGGSLKEILSVACAIELVHTYSLIHDDLPAMDDDDFRRGKLTCHKAFGEANAILAGDALLTLAFNIASKELAPKKCASVIRELSEAIGTRGMVGGQVIDLEFRNKSKTKKMLDYINRLKTSKLFEASTKVGAIVAGSDAKKVKTMARFGAYLGLAFQITDDMLDKGDYAKTFGIAKARRDSGILIEKARRALGIFGKRANRLKKIADYISKRRG